jgi:RHS repeat-associated protein
MSALGAARLADEISHGCGMAAMVTGAVAGAVIGAAVVAATVLSGGTALAIFGSVLFATGATSALGIGAKQIVKGVSELCNLPEPTSGALILGSSNVFINSRNAMRAGVDMAAVCNGTLFNHFPIPVPLIAEGSSTVFINGQPAARLTDKLTCGAHIKTSSNNVFIGDETIRILPVSDWEESFESFLGFLGMATGIGAGVLAACCGVGALAGFAATHIVNNVFGDTTSETLKQFGDSLGPGYGDILQGTESIIGAILPGSKKPKIGANTSRISPKQERTVGEPIAPSTGNYVDFQTDFTYPSVLPLTLSRLYLGRDTTQGALGTKWLCNWSQRLLYKEQEVIFEDADGFLLHFPVEADTNFQSRHYNAPHYELTGKKSTARIFDSRTQQTLTFAVSPVDPSIGRLTHIEDRNGNNIRFVYENDKLRQVVHSDGALFTIETAPTGVITSIRRTDCGADETIVRYTYTKEGELADAISRENGQLHYRYNASGLICHWHDSGPTRFDIEYDDKGRVIATKNPEGYYNDQLIYHEEERRTEYIDATGKSIMFWFNEAGKLLQEQDGLGRVTRYEYDSFNRQTAVIDPLGRASRTSYDPFGYPESQTDPANRSTRFGRNDFGQIFAIHYADGSRLSADYDQHGNLIQLTGPDGITTRYAYDTRGQLTRELFADNASRAYTYTADGAIASFRDQNNETTSTRCDRWKRINALTDAKGSVTCYDYTPQGQVSRIVAPDGGVEQFVYNREGALTSRIGQEGQTTDYLHTAFDLLVQAQDANGRKTSFVYDGVTRLTQIINAAGHTWNYRYDQAGQLAAETDWAGRTTTYTRDALGRVISKTLPDGVVQSLTWDAFDRIAEVATPNQRISYEYDPSDRLSRVCTYQADEQEPESRSRYTYDQAGRLSQEVQNGQTIRYRYDELGRMIERTTPSGVTSYGYDPCGRLTHLTSNGHQLHLNRDALGLETERIAAATPHTAFTLRQSYDPCGRLTTQGAGTQGAAIKRTNQWDKAHRLVGVTDSRRGRTGYHYDPADQPYHVFKEVQPKQRHEERYGYDHLLNLGQVNNDTHHYRHSAVIQTGKYRYTYDTRGRVISKKSIHGQQGADYTWDELDRLVGVITSQGVQCRYIYDAFGRRIAKERLSDQGARSTRYLWQGATLIEESQTLTAALDVTHTRTIRHHFEPGTFNPLAREVIEHGNIQFYPIVTDHLGTPKEMFTTNGECVWQSDATLWGRTTEKSLIPHGQPIRCNLRFQNQWEDEETGLHYNLNRYYDPDSGQYLSPDPIGLEGGLRGHGYVHDPLGWVDPLGLSGVGGGASKGVNPLNGTKYTDKVLRQMKGKDLDHNFPSLVDKQADAAKVKIITGGDGIERTKVELPGSINGKDGNYSWIIEPDKTINHRQFERLRNK